MKISEGLIRKRRLVVIVWAITFVALTPLMLNYSHFISYSTSSSVPSSSESSRAQAILAGLSPQNSSLIVVVQSSSGSVQLAREFLLFQKALGGQHIPYFSSSSSAFSSYAQFIGKVQPGTNGTAYVIANGLVGAPNYIMNSSVSPDKSTYLVTLNFNVTESYRASGNVYPAQSATPAIRQLAQTYLGSAAQVTGQGAIAYDSQSLTASSGYVFGFTFVFLAIAVAITLVSLVSPLVALLFVSLATALGYVSIYVTGLIFGHVDFTVTYTLTAVILGVSTDYLVFYLSRYREELRKGSASSQALVESSRRAGFAIAVSGLTVASGLGALTSVADLNTWGPVLLLSILMTVALEITLLPAVASYIGPRMFLKRTMKSSNGTDYRRSKFYRAAQFSSRRKYLVAGVILLLAVPSVYFWFNVPTTFNFAEGLPKSLSSVQALNTVDQRFGSNLIYPNFAIVNFTQSVLLTNGTLTSAGASAIAQSSSYIKSLPGVQEVVGATSGGAAGQAGNPFVFNGGHNAYFLVFTSFDPYSQQAIQLIGMLRDNHGFLVGGLTSSIIDLQSASAAAYTQLEVLLVVVIAVILAVSFRSLKYPVISLSGVFISITWTTGILYAVSKYLLGEELIYLIPIILYIILMSLGNDFTVFIFTRVREEQAKLGFTEGLARAMVGSGTVVTALGLILAVSLGSLALVPFGFLEQVGIGFIISLVLDTFVIRTFYFPAMIRLLKGKNQQ
ncbi:MAG: MMPL family transporter [Nitrososphaerales archaeon]|jgi:RND superfamily putative drug exporter